MYDILLYITKSLVTFAIVPVAYRASCRFASRRPSGFWAVVPTKSTSGNHKCNPTNADNPYSWINNCRCLICSDRAGYVRSSHCWIVKSEEGIPFTGSGKFSTAGPGWDASPKRMLFAAFFGRNAEGKMLLKTPKERWCKFQIVCLVGNWTWCICGVE